MNVKKEFIKKFSSQVKPGVGVRQPMRKPAFPFGCSFTMHIEREKVDRSSGCAFLITLNVSAAIPTPS